MAFQMSKLAARVSLSKSVGFISSAGNRCPSHLSFISRLAHRSFHALCGAGRGSASIKVLPSPGVLRKADRWEKVSTASKSLHRQSGGAVKPRRFTRVVIGAVGVSAAVLASLSTSALHALPLNLDSESSDWKEAKKKLCSMDKEKRREMYRVDFIPLEKIPVWSPSGDSSCKPRYKVNEELNRKISLFRGDITKLEIDAIANAANKTLLGGGGVDGAIHRGAGPLLRKECGTLNGCETGEAKITGAYGLPAKHVIHTVGPIVHDSVGESEEQALRNCYYTCLHTAIKNHLRTVAIPCISTGVYGYPPDQAVEVALRTVREYLEQNHEKLDRVIFCVFLKSDKELYETMLPAYFPRGSPPKSKL
ncbi:O-acetyl-ADP-ribose deacetylase MACROD1-like isoform X1 [Sinocyclocheilus grahami]|uniref:O-acetyl-ADP-ribose deacetylase MACROD1-like n=1 Tax=Sinocyclocheilus grahami TaxID=75366 RepID=A0A672MZ60_SINGR|nr:PREDICTED: O-acetyl-ADP-ribose deacetylase MACROD1-like isoform X1 [Sinocyclocheilus grahami]